MFDITKLYLKIPNFMSNEECDFLIKCHEEEAYKAVDEISTESLTRKTQQATFKALELTSRTKAFNLARQRTGEVVKIYSDYLDSSGLFHKNIRYNLRYSHKYRILKYGVGGKIHSHSDHESFTYGSVSINLNDDYDGGQFKMFNGKHTVELGKGDALVFPGDLFWTHEVTEVTRGARYSLNSFIRRLPFEISEHFRGESARLEKEYLTNVPREDMLGPYHDIKLQ